MMPIAAQARTHPVGDGLQPVTPEHRKRTFRFPAWRRHGRQKLSARSQYACDLRESLIQVVNVFEHAVGKYAGEVSIREGQAHGRGSHGLTIRSRNVRLAN